LFRVELGVAATDARIPEHGIVDPEIKTIAVLMLDGGEDKTHGEFR
jgi:hypothetical protein